MCILFYLLLFATCFEACNDSILVPIKYENLFCLFVFCFFGINQLSFFYLYLFLNTIDIIDALYTRHLFHKTYKLYIAALLSGSKTHKHWMELSTQSIIIIIILNRMSWAIISMHLLWNIRSTRKCQHNIKTVWKSIWSSQYIDFSTIIIAYFERIYDYKGTFETKNGG